MKKFHFPLQSALEWRRRQMETEQARLEDLERQRTSLTALLAGVEERWKTSSDELRREKLISSADLESLANYRVAADRQRWRLEYDLRALAAKLTDQKTRLVEATRQFRLMEKLRERRKEEWQRELDAQLEQEAAELYLAQWVNQD